MLIDFFKWRELCQYLETRKDGRLYMQENTPQEIEDKLRAYNIRSLISKGKKLIENLDVMEEIYTTFNEGEYSNFEEFEKEFNKFWKNRNEF